MQSVDIDFVTIYWVGRVHQLLTYAAWQGMPANPVSWSWEKTGREQADLVITDFGHGYWKFFLRISNLSWEFMATAETFLGTQGFWETLYDEACCDTDYLNLRGEMIRSTVHPPKFDGNTSRLRPPDK